jgi:hypothetical protein
VLSLIGYYSEVKTVVLSDAKKLVNVGYARERRARERRARDRRSAQAKERASEGAEHASEGARERRSGARERRSTRAKARTSDVPRATYRERSSASEVARAMQRNYVALLTLLLRLARRYSLYKLALVILLASAGLTATYWNADSVFETQPTLLRLSAVLKTASDGFVLPLIGISTATTVYFIHWGWSIRFEGHVEGTEVGAGRGKQRSWGDFAKLTGLFLYTLATTVTFDFIFVFYVATSQTLSNTTRTLLSSLLSLFKANFLNSRWVARTALDIFNPTKR